MEKETKLSCFFLIFILCFSVQGLMRTEATSLSTMYKEENVYLNMHRPQKLMMDESFFEERLLKAKQTIKAKSFQKNKRTKDIHLIY